MFSAFVGLQERKGAGEYLGDDDTTLNESFGDDTCDNILKIEISIWDMMEGLSHSWLQNST